LGSSRPVLPIPDHKVKTELFRNTPAAEKTPLDLSIAKA